MKISPNNRKVIVAGVMGMLLLSASGGPLAWAHAVSNYFYDAGGRLTYVTLGGGKSIEYIYDSSSNLLRKTVTVFADTDTDQMNDAWEQQYFTGLSRDGTGDFDNDGLSDLDEYRAGTDPTDPQSLLKATLIKEGGAHYSVEWPTVPGRRYLLQYKDDLNSPVWTNLFDPYIATSQASSFYDESSNATTTRYYRLLIVPAS
jgi:YD repeat-containing protein